MSSQPTYPLHELLIQSAKKHFDRPAVVDPTGPQLSYAQLDRLSDRVRDRLVALGIGRGDRVGLCIRKSVDSLAAIFGILKAGAAYVPVDPEAPAARDAYVFHHCGVKALFVDQKRCEELAAELTRLSAAPRLLPLDFSAADVPLVPLLDALEHQYPTPGAETVASGADETAYILYTSGSTGLPKGVNLSHRNAVSFVDWCSSVFEPDANDRFSSHAPLHFDLSILDLFVPIRHGAAVVLVGEATGKEPAALAKLIAEEQITCWYSTPSVLALLVQFGRMEQYDYPALRIVNFAGEVFPIKHLRRLKELWPRPRYFNLYGPTETNVCTWYEVPRAIDPERRDPYPIGPVCSHAHGRVVDLDGNDVPRGAEGELLIAGDGVMLGYWNAPEADARVFVRDAQGERWYRTGDLVVETPDAGYIYHGRRDRMVKKRGYRIELGEIESGLYRHPAVKEAAVVALSGEEGVRIKAYLVCDDPRPSLIALKQHCAAHLISYMVPDLFAFTDALPKTSTDKIDYRRLQEQG